MRENISELTKKAVIEFRKLGNTNKLYFTSIILNHLSNGLINDGNYLNSDEAYENNKLVLESSDINLDDPMKLATNILVIASNIDGLNINPNGIDIEPYIKDKEILKSTLSQFYNLNFVDKIDFLTEMFYDVSEIKEVENFDFDYNELINELLNYRKNNFVSFETNSLEIENN